MSFEFVRSLGKKARTYEALLELRINPASKVIPDFRLQKIASPL